MKRRAGWPALEGSLPSVIEYERGVWGKVHGARTDFRWIARSAHFAETDLQLRLSLGAEDVPASFQMWRSLGDRCYAVTCYPSRAIDAEGRRGFLEKQMLEWRRPPEVPAALGALLLLPRVAAMTDGIWWERDDVSDLQAQADAVLSIVRGESVMAEETLADTIERGREALSSALDPRSLEQLYDQLLAGAHPAWLTGLRRPLSPEALAALLLPLPRDIADRISIAGWIPSSRPSFDDLASRWDVLPDDRAVASLAPEKAHATARGLLQGTPANVLEPEPIVVEPKSSPAVARTILRPGMRLRLRAPDSDALLLHELHQFATSVDRRWLDPRSLRHRIGAKGSYPSDLLCEWVETVRRQRPVHVDQGQWAAKADLLRSAAYVLAPTPATIQAMGIPDLTSRVPALIFGLMLDDRREWNRLFGLGAEPLQKLIKQSRDCARSPAWAPQLGQWLQRWDRA